MQAKKRRKIRPGTKLAFWFLGILGAAYVFWYVLVGGWILSQKFPPIKPGVVTILGIQSVRGVRIVVANRVANVQEDPNGGGKFASDNSGDSGGEPNNGIRVPLNDLVDVLGGGPNAATSLSDFVTQLNQLHDDSKWPTVQVVWKAADIQKALDGDPVLSKKLQNDINVDFAGNPLPQLNVTALENGIVVDVPCPVTFTENGQQKTIVATIQRLYRPKFLEKTNAMYEKLFHVNDKIRLYYYLQEVHAIQAGKASKENVMANLKGLISPASVAAFGDRAANILDASSIVLSDRYIDTASYTKDDIGGKRLFDMDIHVNEEGRRRLWQYSKRFPGDQLLVVMGGIAIAAPRIDHELYSRDLIINQLPDESLVKETVQSIKAHKLIS